MGDLIAEQILAGIAWHVASIFLILPEFSSVASLLKAQEIILVGSEAFKKLVHLRGFDHCSKFVGCVAA